MNCFRKIECVVGIDTGRSNMLRPARENTQKCYGGTLHDGFNDYLQIQNGYILAGGAQSGNGDVSGNHHPALGFPDVWIVAVDNLGNIYCCRVFGRSQRGARPDRKRSIK